MKVKMVSSNRVLCLCSGDYEYRPDEAGHFLIDEDHVEAARCHGFILASERTVFPIGQRLVTDENAALAAENARLRALIVNRGPEGDVSA